MNTIEAQPVEMAFSDDPIGRLKDLHSSLIQRHRQEVETAKLLDDVESFIREGQRAGIILAREADRWELQGILDFWVAILHRAGRVPPEATLAELDEDQAPKFRDAQCPYLGLAAFGEIDETRFFGRRQLLDELKTRVDQNPLVAVVGPPGSGASSLIFAGLVPLLKKGEAIPGSQDWRYYPTIIPGNNPLSSLARALLSNQADSAAKSAVPLNQQVTALQANPARIIFLLPAAAPGKSDVLVIDQFEEAFTLCTDERERNAFIDALVVLIQQPQFPIKLILIMGAAYRGRIARLQSATFKQRFDQGLLLVSSPADDELRAMIEQPARAIGLNIEREVVDELIADVRGEPSATYLLQDTLVRLWALRKYNWLTLDAYRKLGGAKYALVQGAQKVYGELSAKEKNIAKALLLRLVHVGIDREPVCRRVLRSELLQNHQYTAEDADCVLKKLASVGVVRQSRTDSSADTQVELMHEALIQNWQELRTWLWDSWEELRQRQRLTDNAHLWEESGRSANLLLQGGELENAQSLTDLDALEGQYVRASITAKLQANKRQKQIYWGVITALAAVLLVVSLLALMTWNAKQDAMQAKNIANVRLASLLSSEAEQALTSKPQLSLLLAVEAVNTSPQVGGGPAVTETLLALQQALSTTTSYPLRGFAKQVIIDAVQIAASPDEAWLAVGSQNGMVHLWNLTAGEVESAQVNRRAHDREVTALAFSPDGRWLSTGGADALVNVFDLHRPEAEPVRVPLNQSDGPITALAFEPTSPLTQTWLAVSTLRGVVQWIDLLAAAHPIVSDRFGEQSRATAALAFSPDGKWLATMSVTGDLRVWPLQTTALPSAARLLNQDKNDGIAFSPNGQWLATASKGDTTIYLYKLDDPNLSQIVIRGSVTDKDAIRFSPDSGLLAAGGSDGVVRLWRLEELRYLGEPTAAQGNQKSSSKSVIPARPSELTNSTVEPLALPQRSGAVGALAYGVYDQGGENETWLLAAAGADRAVELWNIDALTTTWFILYGHDTAVKSVIFAEKSGQLFAGSQDGTVRIWSLAAQNQAPQNLNQLADQLPQWIAEACRRAGRGFSADESAEYFGDVSVKPTCKTAKIVSGQ